MAIIPYVRLSDGRHRRRLIKARANYANRPYQLKFLFPPIRPPPLLFSRVVVLRSAQRNNSGVQLVNIHRSLRGCAHRGGREGGRGRGAHVQDDAYGIPAANCGRYLLPFGSPTPRHIRIRKSDKESRERGSCRNFYRKFTSASLSVSRGEDRQVTVPRFKSISIRRDASNSPSLRGSVFRDPTCSLAVRNGKKKRTCIGTHRVSIRVLEGRVQASVSRKEKYLYASARAALPAATIQFASPIPMRACAALECGVVSRVNERRESPRRPKVHARPLDPVRGPATLTRMTDVINGEGETWNNGLRVLESLRESKTRKAGKGTCLVQTIFPL